MEIDRRSLRNLISKRRDEIERAVEGAGYSGKVVQSQTLVCTREIHLG